ncbi:hypothetical protein DL766_009566 [Monosporascus sp. MC13-8B]|uniref:Secreted protein n=1 Tax=Monosporascus cannonballus TaxID=155416 RepID=A0ABY0HKC3_9PEZI|nr:hypothetical protein DL763_009506 [Monosporascus cannonballus]RYO92619.1 hypothetical protein DL762_001522 [Monosporascus cannonballus]RYP14838.1 hypothetical protein DL766_009566 [Monosporascus sp. MC13-8B]
MMFSPYIVFLAATAGLLATTNAVPAGAVVTPSATSAAVDPLRPEPVPTTCTTTHLPYALLPPAGNRPGVPVVHQGVEHDGTVLDGLLPDDADDYCVERNVRNMRPLPYPNAVDHVHDGLPRRAYHYRRDDNHADVPVPGLTSAGLAGGRLSRGKR